MGLLAIEREKGGGLRTYKRELWERIAFGARYGNQSIDLLLRYDSDDLRNFNMALGLLIQDENKTQ